MSLNNKDEVFLKWLEEENLPSLDSGPDAILPPPNAPPLRVEHIGPTFQPHSKWQKVIRGVVLCIGEVVILGAAAYALVYYVNFLSSAGHR